MHNYYIVAGLFYFIIMIWCMFFKSLIRQKVKGWGAMDMRGNGKG